MLPDDYEEGTFTPVLQGGALHPTSITYAHQLGKYIKIGNQVTINYYMEINAQSGGSVN